MAAAGASCTWQEWPESVAEDIPEVVLVPVQKTCVLMPPQLLTSAVVAYKKIQSVAVSSSFIKYVVVKTQNNALVLLQ